MVRFRLRAFAIRSLQPTEPKKPGTKVDGVLGPAKRPHSSRGPAVAPSPGEAERRGTGPSSASRWPVDAATSIASVAKPHGLSPSARHRRIAWRQEEGTCAPPPPPTGARLDSGPGWASPAPPTWSQSPELTPLWTPGAKRPANLPICNQVERALKPLSAMGQTDLRSRKELWVRAAGQGWPAKGLRAAGVSEKRH